MLEFLSASSDFIDVVPFCSSVVRSLFIVGHCNKSRQWVRFKDFVAVVVVVAIVLVAVVVASSSA